MISENSLAKGHRQLSNLLFTNSASKGPISSNHISNKHQYTNSQQIRGGFSSMGSNKVDTSTLMSGSTKGIVSMKSGANNFDFTSTVKSSGFLKAPKEMQFGQKNYVSRAPQNMSMSIRKSDMQAPGQKNFLGDSQLKQSAFFGVDMPKQKGNSNPRLTNLKMGLKGSMLMEAEKEFEIMQDNKDKMKVFINDNFQDNEFTDQGGKTKLFKESTIDMSIVEKELPLWATGFDQEHKMEGNLKDYLKKEDDGIDMVGPMVKGSKDALLDFQNSLKDGLLTVEQLYEVNRAKLTEHLKLPERTGIFFAPSEASAQYLVIAIVAALNPDKESFHNIITGTRRDDIDEDVLIATEGKYFSSAVVNKKFDKKPKNLERLQGLPSWTTSQVLDNRQVDGVENDYYDKVFDIIKLCETDDQQTLPILQSMGTLDKYMEKIWWKIYDCGDIQVYNHLEGRVEIEKLHKHLENGDLFIFNGSKFYSSPMDCAAILVPYTVMDLLEISEWEHQQQFEEQWNGENGLQMNGLNNFFGKNDFPKELPLWRKNIDKNDNAGLALRWSAAIASMEELSNYEESALQNQENDWKKKIKDIIEGLPILNHENLQSPFVSGNSPKSTIDNSHVTISIHETQKHDQTWLTKTDLAHINSMMAQDMSNKIDWEYQVAEHKSTNIVALNEGNIQELKKIAALKVKMPAPIRKPVQITHEDGAIQFSLSFSGLKKQMDSSEKDVCDEQMVLQKLALIAFAYPELSKSMKGSSYNSSVIQQNFAESATGSVIDQKIIDNQISNLENEIDMKQKQLEQWKEMAKDYK